TGDAGIAPEAHLAVLGGNLDLGGHAVHEEDRAGQGVLRPAAVRGRTESIVAPRAGPGRRALRVDQPVRVRLLVAHERPIRLPSRSNGGLPSRLPEDLVAAEEREVHARVPRRLDVRALRPRP